MMTETALSGKKYRAYSEYKDSPIDWLDEIPSHWKTTKLKFQGSAIIGLTYSPSEIVDANVDSATLVLRSSNVQNQKVTLNDNVFVNKTITEKLTTKLNDILICSRNGSRSLIGKNAKIDNKSVGMTFGAFMTIFRSKYNFYFSHVFNSKLFEYQSGSFLTSTINQLTTGNLNSFEIPFPPENELEPIANFLDHETAKIDTLVTKQEKLIELLKEKRQAVISHAVTRGLNPYAPMKDSGVEWLGEVPNHWVVTPIKRIAELTPKKSQIRDKKVLECSFVPMDKLKQDSLVLDESKLISEVYDGYTYFENEDVLIAKVTPCFENKNMVVARDLVNGIGFGSSEIYVLRTNNNIANDFLYYRLQENVFMDIATAAMSGAGGLKRVPADVITNFSIALPTEREQLEIVGFLKKRLKQLDLLSSKAKSAIILMKERKTALISAAVTGKIDVRNYNAEKAEG